VGRYGRVEVKGKGEVEEVYCKEIVERKVGDGENRTIHSPQRGKTVA
jgi:hypothetical protein